VITLHPYQSELADAVRRAYRDGFKAPLVVLPTGGGKTVIFSYITSSAASKGRTVILLCHRSELIRQISKSLARFETVHAVIAPDSIVRQCKVDHFHEFGRSYVWHASTIYVASVQTLVRRMPSLSIAPDIIVCDEAHHLTASSTWGKIAAHYPDAKLLPVTATPCRLDGKGLGKDAGGFADTILHGPSMRWLIDNGYLSDYRIFAPPTAINLADVKTRMGDYAKEQLSDAVDKPKITGDAIQHYQRLCHGKRAIVFCVSVAHAEHVAAEFRQAGIRSESLDGGMDSGDRSKTIERFTSGETLVLTSCDIVSEGFDLPAIECAILLRPTKSLSLYLQQVGRALRVFAGKEYAIILDHVGNVARHGLPDTDREWSLEGVKKRTRKDDQPDISITTCKQCYSIYPSRLSACPVCRAGRPQKERDIDHVDGELVEITAEQKQAMRFQRKREERDCKTLEDFIALGKQRGYQYPVQWARKRVGIRNVRKSKPDGLHSNQMDV